MKKLVCLFLVFAIALSTSVFAAVEPLQPSAFLVASDRDLPEPIIDRLFSKTYTFWDNQGNNVTSYVYSEFSDDYLSKNYSVISDYLRSTIAYAEYIVVNDRVRGNKQLVTVERYGTKYFRDTTYNAVQLLLHYFVDLTVYFDDDTCEITEALAPDVWQITPETVPGLMDLDAWTENERATVASNGMSATFRFDLLAELYYVTGTDFPPSGSTLEYEGSVTEIVYVDDLVLNYV